MIDQPQPDYALLDRLGVGGSIFYPRAELEPPPPGAEDHAILVAPEVHLGSRFYPADPAWPSVLFFHGNGEVASDYDDTAQFYHRAQLNLWVADYRGYGASGGRPSFAALIGDAQPVLDRFHAVLDERGFSAARFVMGRSLGAYPACEIAAQRPERLRGLIIESGAANLERLLRRLGPGAPPGEAAALAAAHQARIAAISLPALVMHGEVDELIPIEAALGFYELLTMARKQIVIIPGAGHNDILWVGLRQYFEELARFVGEQVTV